MGKLVNGKTLKLEYTKGQYLAHFLVEFFENTYFASSADDNPLGTLSSKIQTL